MPNWKKIALEFFFWLSNPLLRTIEIYYFSLLVPLRPPPAYLRAYSVFNILVEKKIVGLLFW